MHDNADCRVRVVDLVQETSAGVHVEALAKGGTKRPTSHLFKVVRAQIDEYEDEQHLEFFVSGAS